jgi:hypothetical protein
VDRVPWVFHIADLVYLLCVVTRVLVFFFGKFRYGRGTKGGEYEKQRVKFVKMLGSVAFRGCRKKKEGERGVYGKGGRNGI